MTERLLIKSNGQWELSDSEVPTLEKAYVANPPPGASPTVTHEASPSAKEQGPAPGPRVVDRARLQDATKAWRNATGTSEHPADFEVKSPAFSYDQISAKHEYPEFHKDLVHAIVPADPADPERTVSQIAQNMQQHLSGADKVPAGEWSQNVQALRGAGYVQNAKDGSEVEGEGGAGEFQEFPQRQALGGWGREGERGIIQHEHQHLIHHDMREKLGSAVHGAVMSHMVGMMHPAALRRVRSDLKNINDAALKNNRPMPYVGASNKEEIISRAHDIINEGGAKSRLSRDDRNAHIAAMHRMREFAKNLTTEQAHKIYEDQIAKLKSSNQT